MRILLPLLLVLSINAAYAEGTDSLRAMRDKACAAAGNLDLSKEQRDKASEECQNCVKQIEMPTLTMPDMKYAPVPAGFIIRATPPKPPKQNVLKAVGKWYLKRVVVTYDWTHQHVIQPVNDWAERHQGIVNLGGAMSGWATTGLLGALHP